MSYSLAEFVEIAATTKPNIAWAPAARIAGLRRQSVAAVPECIVTNSLSVIGHLPG